MRVPFLKLPRVLLIWLALIGADTIHATAVDLLQAQTTVKDRSSRLFLDLSYNTLVLSGVSLSGAGIQGAYVTAISDSFGLGISISQAFSASFTALFTQVSVEAVYALTGNLILKKKALLLNGLQVSETEDLPTAGIRLHGYLHQYFLNAARSSLPLPGVGVGVSYEFPLATQFGARVGARLDTASNGSFSSLPIRFFAGVGIWL